MTPEPARSKQYWFPVKRYGWGWGLPIVWQGWVVLVAYTSLLSAALVGICLLKGEPPRWHWGDER